MLQGEVARLTNGVAGKAGEVLPRHKNRFSTRRLMPPISCYTREWGPSSCRKVAAAVTREH